MRRYFIPILVALGLAAPLLARTTFESRTAASNARVALDDAGNLVVVPVTTSGVLEARTAFSNARVRTDTSGNLAVTFASVPSITGSGGQVLDMSVADVTTLSRTTNNQRFVFGLASNLYPALNRSTTGLTMTLGDGTAGGFFTAPTLNATTSVTSPLYTATGGTVTTSAPIVSGTQTWNAGAVSFIGTSYAYTETASAAGSRYFQILGGAAGATDEFYITKGGNGTFGGGLTLTGDLQSQGTSGAIYWNGGDVYQNRIAAGVWGLRNDSSHGVGVDVTTDAVLFCKTRANTDGCTLKANNLTTSGLLQGSGTGTSVANVGGNSCGTTTATIAGNQVSGVITVGATSGTQCRVTFTTAAPTARDCTANDDTTTVAVRTTPVDTSNTDFIGAFGGGDKLTYQCTVR